MAMRFNRWNKRRKKNLSKSRGRGRSRSLRIEAMEPRQMLAGQNFLQGIAFVDADADNQIDVGEARKFNTTIQLWSGDGSTLLDSTTTNVNGYYRFDDLAPGTYRLVEVAPSGFGNQGVEFYSPLSPASAINASTIEVTLLAPAAMNATLTFDDQLILANMEDINFDLFGQPEGAAVGPIPVTVSGGGLVDSATFDSYCIDYFELLDFGDNDFDFTLHTLSPLDNVNFPRIAYLFNHYGTNIFGTQVDTTVEGAALQLAIFELLYDSGNDADPFNTGNLQNLTPYTEGLDNTTPQDIVDVIAFAEALLVESHEVVVVQGYDEAALMLDPVLMADGRQPLIGPGFYNFANLPQTPGIDIEKTTNGSTNTNPTAPDYDNEDTDDGPGVPLLAPGSTVTWTYKVTNTGDVPFASSEVVVVDDSGTPSNTSDDLSTTGGGITFLSVETGDADNILEPGEVWLYTASGIVEDLGASNPPVTFDFSGNSGTSGAAGNVRTYSAGGLSVNASAFSRDASGNWATAFLGAYSGGLGVTDGSETGSGDTHTVDNSGRNNYVLLEFSEAVVIDSALLGYVVGDSDLTVWIGTVTDPFNNHQALSDAFLSGLGFSEVNDTTLSSARTADLNAGGLAGNVIIIAAKTADALKDDRFKLEKVTVATHACYENKGTVFVPGASDSDLSHYCNSETPPPPTNPGIDIEKTTTGTPNANPTAPDYDNEDAANGAGVPLLTPGTTVTWTYKVTNTGDVPFTTTQIVVSDDSGTPSNTSDDMSTTGGQITFLSVQTGDADNILEPGEVWLYKASGMVQDLSAPAAGAPTVFDMSGSSSVTGSTGNVRTFTSGSLSVKASAFSRDSSGAWSTAYLGSYGGGLGVTDGSESGSSDTHTVDNLGRDNYVLMRFSENVIVDSAFLGYVVGDSDVKVWIGTISNAFTGSVTLSDAVLASLGFTEVSLGSGGSTRVADLNAGNVSGNVLVIAADPGDDTPDDRFKLELVTVRKTQPGIYQNKGKVVVPGASDSDLSHYKNSTTPPPSLGSIGGKKYKDQTGNGLTSDDVPLAGTTIYLDLDNDSVKDANEPSTTTGSDGRYQFGGLAAGTYVVREIVSNGFIRTAPSLSDNYVVTIGSGTAATGKDFANFEIPCTDCTLTNVSYTIKRGSNTFTVTDLRGKTDQGDIVTVNFTVRAGAGIPQLSLMSYTAPDPYFDANRASLQKIYDAQTGFFMPGTHSMTVTIPSYYFQVDFVCGAIIDTLGPAGSNIFYTPQGRLISADNDGTKAPPSNVAPLGTTLVVGGGSGNDDLQFAVASDPSKIAVKVNGAQVGAVSFGAGSGVSIKALLGNGNAGSDSILVTGLSLPATLRGGDGNDILVGGMGADSLQGDGGRDLMIGGGGKDLIRGNAHEDILIGGTTAYDSNLFALDKIMQEWGRTDVSFTTRVNRLKSTASDGLNGSYNLVSDGTSKTVFDDEVQDSLYGDDGNDWILGNTDGDGGSVKDLIYSASVVTDID
jgi:hypothetical protein